MAIFLLMKWRLLDHDVARTDFCSYVHIWFFETWAKSCRMVISQREEIR